MAIIGGRELWRPAYDAAAPASAAEEQDDPIQAQLEREYQGSEEEEDRRYFKMIAAIKAASTVAVETNQLHAFWDRISYPQ